MDPDVTGSIVSYGWDFDGDGTIDQTTTSAAPVTHMYSTFGAYTAKLTVTDDLGAKGTATVLIDRPQRAADRGALDLPDGRPDRASR